jgi:hypothetical protein
MKIWLLLFLLFPLVSFSDTEPPIIESVGRCTSFQVCTNHGVNDLCLEPGGDEAVIHAFGKWTKFSIRHSGSAYTCFAAYNGFGRDTQPAGDIMAIMTPAIPSPIVVEGVYPHIWVQCAIITVADLNVIIEACPANR